MNEIVIATAGSGKTQYLIDNILGYQGDRPILILTYTISNVENIRSRIWEKLNHIPSNIQVIPWFTFLLRHGIKPYSNLYLDYPISGVHFVQKTSAVKFYTKKGFPVVFSENDEPQKHYLNSKGAVFSDKLSKLTCKINSISGGKVIRRLEELYSHVFIDEIQDLASDDLNIIKLLLNSKIETILVGDPRQVTYVTHHSRKFKKYKDGGFDQFIINECKKHIDSINYDKLSGSYRCNDAICSLASMLFPDLPSMTSLNKENTGHDCICTVDPTELDAYNQQYNPIQLRNDKSVFVSSFGSVLTFGISKGLTYDRILIFPTKPMHSWLRNHDYNLKFGSRCKLYVALTRARFSVGIVTSNHNIPNVERWIN